MKRLLLGMVLGALLGGVGVKAHGTYYDNDDIMRRLDQLELNVTNSIIIWCGE